MNESSSAAATRRSRRVKSAIKSIRKKLTKLRMEKGREYGENQGEVEGQRMRRRERYKDKGGGNKGDPRCAGEEAERANSLPACFRGFKLHLCPFIMY